MILSTVKNPAEAHTVFILWPRMIFDRASGTAQLVCLQRVSRKMVSISGTTMWSYSKCESTSPVDDAVVAPVATAQDKPLADYVLPWLDPIKNDEYPVVPIEFDEAIAFDEDIIDDRNGDQFVRIYRNGEWSNPLLFSGNANDYKDGQLVSGSAPVPK